MIIILLEILNYLDVLEVVFLEIFMVFKLLFVVYWKGLIDFCECFYKVFIK